MANLSIISDLRLLLLQMECDIGLEDLSRTERDVLLAAHAVARQNGGKITSDQIRSHDLARKLAQASYHRALKTLIEAGFLDKADGYKARHYVVRGDISRSPRGA